MWASGAMSLVVVRQSILLFSSPMPRTEAGAKGKADTAELTLAAARRQR